MARADELLMEPQPVVGASAAGPIKSILFHVHDDDGLDSRLQAALSLARACSAHLELLHVVPVDAFSAVDTYGGAYVSGEIVAALQDQAAKVQTLIQAHLGKEDVSWSYASVTSSITAELLQNAALSDLLVMGREPHWHEFGRTGPGLIAEVLCTSRTPVCIPGDTRETFDPFGPALVAWNGSIEAANAVRSSVGLLKMSSDVRVVRFTEDKEIRVPDTSVLEYLSRHGVHAEVETHIPRTDTATDLMDLSVRMGAEYVVMGGYSHSRAGEFFFGGVTRELLYACPVSLVLAH